MKNRFVKPTAAISAAVAILALGASGSANACEKCGGKSPAKQSVTTVKYKVVRGDTLSCLAARYGTTVASIQQANKTCSTWIYAGETLKIPATRNAKPKGGKTATHTVRRGENLSCIARIYGSSVGQIKTVNCLRSTVILPGQKLKVPSAG